MCFQWWYIADSALHSSCWHFCIALLRSTFQLTCTPSAALHLQWGILHEIFKKNSYPPVNVYITMERPTMFQWEIPLFRLGHFQVRKLLVYQRVSHLPFSVWILLPEFSHGFSHGNLTIGDLTVSLPEGTGEINQPDKLVASSPSQVVGQGFALLVDGGQHPASCWSHIIDWFGNLQEMMVFKGKSTGKDGFWGKIDRKWWFLRENWQEMMVLEGKSTGNDGF